MALLVLLGLFGVSYLLVSSAPVNEMKHLRECKCYTSAATGGACVGMCSWVCPAAPDTLFAFAFSVAVMVVHFRLWSSRRCVCVYNNSVSRVRP